MFVIVTEMHFGMWKESLAPLFLEFDLRKTLFQIKRSPQKKIERTEILFHNVHSEIGHP